MSFKQKRNLMKLFVESLFEVMCVYEFQRQAISYEDIRWVSVWSNVSLWVSNKSEFLLINWLSLGLKLGIFMSFKEKLILMKTFLVSQFKVI